MRLSIPGMSRLIRWPADRRVLPMRILPSVTPAADPRWPFELSPETGEPWLEDATFWGAEPAPGVCLSPRGVSLLALTGPFASGGSRLAPCRLTPVKSALVRSAPIKLAPDRFVVCPEVEKLAFASAAPSKMAPCRFAPEKLAPVRSRPAKL